MELKHAIISFYIIINAVQTHSDKRNKENGDLIKINKSLNIHESKDLLALERDLFELNSERIYFKKFLDQQDLDFKELATESKSSYLLDYKVYLFFQLKNPTRPFWIYEMGTDTEFISLNTMDPTNVNNVNLYNKLISSFQSTKTTDYYEPNITLEEVKTIFFVFRYQKNYTTSFLDSIFIINKQCFVRCENSFVAKEIEKNDIKTYTKLFLITVLASQNLESQDTSITKDEENNQPHTTGKVGVGCSRAPIITESDKNYQDFLIKTQNLLKESLNNKNMTKNYKRRLGDFLLDSNKRNTYKLNRTIDVLCSRYISKNEEISAMIDKQQNQIEQILGDTSFIRTCSFWESGLLILFISVIYILCLIVILFHIAR
ncbi:hypothetical protein CDIK_1682 [Cucumispora dikerogammari]|nr:hypothetical protein CDIK_1682 [Cucumispora dikerogammari]